VAQLRISSSGQKLYNHAREFTHAFGELIEQGYEGFNDQDEDNIYFIKQAEEALMGLHVMLDDYYAGRGGNIWNAIG